MGVHNICGLCWVTLLLNTSRVCSIAVWQLAREPEHFSQVMYILVGVNLLLLHACHLVCGPGVLTFLSHMWGLSEARSLLDSTFALFDHWHCCVLPELHKLNVVQSRAHQHGQITSSMCSHNMHDLCTVHRGQSLWGSPACQLATV